MMNRLFVMILLLTPLLLITMPARTVATEGMVLQDFDREACYSNCPCDMPGMEQACADCMQKCDDEFWKDFDAGFGKKKAN
jgi:hypothetical protein